MAYCWHYLFLSLLIQQKAVVVVQLDSSLDVVQGRFVTSLLTFKARLDGALSNLIWLKMSLLTAGGLGWVTSKGPFQPKAFNDSMIPGSLGREVGRGANYVLNQISHSSCLPSGEPSAEPRPRTQLLV